MEAGGGESLGESADVKVDNRDGVFPILAVGAPSVSANSGSGTGCRRAILLRSCLACRRRRVSLCLDSVPA